MLLLRLPPQPEQEVRQVRQVGEVASANLPHRRGLPDVHLAKVSHRDGNLEGMFPNSSAARLHRKPPVCIGLLRYERHHRRRFRHDPCLPLQFRLLQRQQRATVSPSAAESNNEATTSNHTTTGTSTSGKCSATKFGPAVELPGQVCSHWGRLLPRVKRPGRLDRGSEDVRAARSRARCSSIQGNPRFARKPGEEARREEES